MPPVKIPCYCGTMRQATRALTQTYDRFLKPAGIKASQFPLLSAIATVPQIRTGQISEALVLDSTTLTRTLATLENQGWITTEESEDRRERRWVLTREGQKVVDRALPLWSQAQAHVVARIGEEKARLLHEMTFDLIDKIRA